ncbi:hypothetical protein Tsubulata_045581 [Turnera subulata]|uniref:Uncharacterized protein n=1 Tax=Turnera subulata TaxID=218843 RepID=A0A9Q0G5G0_9ROSI|nr:hypothetical protein Tsubulata_045581 [Turnera subulata]
MWSDREESCERRLRVIKTGRNHVNKGGVSDVDLLSHQSLRIFSRVGKAEGDDFWELWCKGGLVAGFGRLGVLRGDFEDIGCEMDPKGSAKEY